MLDIDKNIWSNQNFDTLLVEVEIGTTTLDNNLAFSGKKEHKHTQQPTVATPRYSLGISCTCALGTHVRMFIEAMLVMAKNRKPKCPSTEK